MAEQVMAMTLNLGKRLPYVPLTRASAGTVRREDHLEPANLGPQV
jgi:hypothetical protein